MKRYGLFLPILLACLFTACSKHYQGDLDAFSLSGEWEMAYSAKSGTVVPEKASRWHPVVLPGRVAVPETARVLFLRKSFVLPGHFPDRQIYLYLGAVGESLRVVLNGHSLIRDGSPLHHFSNLHPGELLLEVRPDELHYGKVNQLEFTVSTQSLPDTLLSGNPGLYTRLGFLRMKGLAVQECDFSLERDLHARLEDLAVSWLKGDSLKLADYFSGSSLQHSSASRMLLVDMLRVRRMIQPVDIELYRPEFFRCPVQGKILVLGEWRFHRKDGRVERMPFQWAFTREQGVWKLVEPVRLGKGMSEM